MPRHEMASFDAGKSRKDCHLLRRSYFPSSAGQCKSALSLLPCTYHIVTPINHEPPRQSSRHCLEPPHDVDAEHAVLAVVLLEPGRIADVAAALEPADCGNEVNRTIYTAMLRLHFSGKSIDDTLVVGELQGHVAFIRTSSCSGDTKTSRPHNFEISF
jgi:hypothetical protein